MGSSNRGESTSRLITRAVAGQFLTSVPCELVASAPCHSLSCGCSNTQSILQRASWFHQSGQVRGKTGSKTEPAF